MNYLTKVLSLSMIILFSLSSLKMDAQIVDIESTTEGFLAPRMTTVQRDAIPNPVNGSLIFNVSTGRFNYYNVLVAQWEELYPGPHSGTHYLMVQFFLTQPNGLQILLNAGETPADLLNAGASISDLIGLNYAGGLIFHVNPNGSGFVAAPADLPILYEWGCYYQDVNGANGFAIGTGSQNTTEIVSGCLVNPADAATACVNYNGGGYTDWYLPSIDELTAIYQNIGPGASGNNNIVGFPTNTAYWSSTEFNAYDAYQLYVNTGTYFIDAKTYSVNVRPVRSF